MRLYEWNELLLYAKNSINKFKKMHPVDIRYNTYSLYDGRQGVNFRIFDAIGNVFYECFSGVYDSLDKMKMQIDMCIRIMEEKIC